jgi:hypothetical protein
VFENAEIIDSGAVFFLNDTAQDIGDVGARIGDSIRCCRLRFSLQFAQPAALTGSHSLRMAIVVDKQNVMANAGDMFIGVGTNHAPWLQYTKDLRLQYAVLYDSFPVALNQYNPSRCLRFDMPLRLNTRYEQTTSTITTGALKAIFISDLPGGAPQKVQVTGTIRVDYTDN